MKKFVLLFLVLISVLINNPNEARANIDLLVIPDNLEVMGTKFAIYPESSELLAIEVLNYLKGANLNIPSISVVRSQFNSNSRLKTTAKTMLNRFKFSYAPDFVALKQIADSFHTDYICLITTNIDIQNYVLRRTFWDFLNIPGAAVIDPAYKLTTYIVLVSVNDEKILYEQKFNKMLKKVENRILMPELGPNYDVIQKIKMHYAVVSPIVAQNVRMKIDPAYEALVNAELGENQSSLEEQRLKFDEKISNPYKQFYETREIKYLFRAMPKKKVKVNETKVVPVEGEIPAVQQINPLPLPSDTEKEIIDVKLTKPEEKTTEMPELRPAVPVETPVSTETTNPSSSITSEKQTVIETKNVKVKNKSEITSKPQTEIKTKATAKIQKNVNEDLNGIIIKPIVIAPDTDNSGILFEGLKKPQVRIRESK